MGGSFFSDEARWIWTPGPSRRANNYVCFRRTFPVNGQVREAGIHITADTRYELFVNGTWVGHGPPRSWTSPLFVDEYDLMAGIHTGENVVAVLVHEPGTSTFQSIDASPGLLAEISIQDESGHSNYPSNSSWKSLPHEGYVHPVPRISCQQGWEEQFDARVEPGYARWKRADFDDSDWAGADVRGRPGEPPHDSFEKRDIPALTREPVYPEKLVDAEYVRPSDHTWQIEPRALLNPEDRSAGLIRGRMLLLTYIHSDDAQPVRVHAPGGGEWKLNGELLEFTDHSMLHTDSGVAHNQLKPGPNTLMCRMPESSHEYNVTINVWTETQVSFRAYPDQRDSVSPWLALGPFEDEFDAENHPMGNHITASAVHERATEKRYENIWQSGQPDEKTLNAPFARQMGPDMLTAVDARGITASDRPVGNEKPEIDSPEALLTDNPDWTTIDPPADDRDVRLLMDFGDEVVGYHEFMIDAPAGTVVDNQNFEFIQPDGRINLADGMHNSFRYTCREGIQRYRTFIRRGFRYSWLVLRNFDRPIRIRHLRTIFNTYPVSSDGEFHSSDPLLDRMWRVSRRTLRCCMEDTYTDCPTYEQTHWVGDAAVEAQIDLTTNGDPRLSRHCWMQAAQSLDRSPIVESHVPSGWQNLLTAWSLLWIGWAHDHFWFTGDVELARDMLRHIERNVCGISQHINEDDLLDIRAWNMLDWAPVDAPNAGVVTHQNCLCVESLRKAAELAEHLDQKGRSRRWNSLADRMSEAINQHLWSEDKQAYIDSIHKDGKRSRVMSQQTHTMAYLAGIPDPERRERCVSIIQNPPEGFVTVGSPFLMFFILKALSRAGRQPAMLQKIREYWRPQISSGATTFWEFYHQDQARKTRSHCHGWSSGPAYFLSREILGVKPAAPGFERIKIAPHPCDLTEARGRVPTPQGPAQIQWRRENAMFHLHFTLPENIPTLVELPFQGELRNPIEGVRELKGREAVSCMECNLAEVELQVHMNQSE